MIKKELTATSNIDAVAKIPGLSIFGEDLWKVLCKASSTTQGWMKSTKAMEIEGVGCLVQVTTQQLNDTGIRPIRSGHDTETLKSSVVAESVTFVPNTTIEETLNSANEVIGRRLVTITPPATLPKKQSSKG